MLQKFTKVLFVLMAISHIAFSQTVPLDFETPSTSPIDVLGFGDVNFAAIPTAIIANPDMSGNNTSATVLHVNKTDGAQVWAGVSLPIATPIDFSGGNEMTINVWAPAAGTPFQLKIEDLSSPPDANGNPSIFAEVVATTLGGGAWETLTFDMSAFAGFDPIANSYNQIVIFPDFGNIGIVGGADFYMDDILNPTSGPLLPSLPVDFESTSITYTATAFGNATAAVVANPNPTTDNMSATVLNITKPIGAEVWAGASMDLGSPIDFSGSNTITLKFWSDFAGIPVQVKIEDLDSPPDANGNPTVFAEVLLNSTASGAWETMEFDMSTFASFDPTIGYERFVIFPDFGNTPFLNDIPFFFDDLNVITPPPPTGPVLPLSFEDATLAYAPAGFGGVDSTEIIANPDMSGDNTSATAWHLFKNDGAETWAGAFITLATPIDFSSSSVLSMKVWAPNAGTPFNLKVENAADGSIAAEVIRTTSVGGAWETLTFDMAEWAAFDPVNNTYDRVVVFPNFGNMGTGTSYYVDDIENAAPVVTLPSIPVDFESNILTYTLVPFGDAVTERIANPDASGINTSATVLHINKPENAQVWAGVAMPLQNIVDLSAGGVFEMKVWSPDVGTPFMLKFEDLDSPPDANGNPSIISEVIVMNTVANQWETLVFDMTTFAGYDPTHEYDQVVIFPNINNPGNVGGTSYYFDDIVPFTAPIVLPDLNIDFEQAGITYQNFGFGNLNSSVIANPAPAGLNTSATVLSLEKTMGAEVWAGVAVPLQNPVDLATGTGPIFSITVWSPRAGVPFLMKFEDLADPTVIFVETSASTTIANGWETLTYDMSTPSNGTYDPNATYNQIVIFPDFGTAGAGETFFVDDIMHATDVGISEADLAKIKVNVFPNPVEDQLSVQFSIPVSGSITMTVVDMLGRNLRDVDMGNLSEGNYQDVINMSGLNSGAYFMLMRLDGEIISSKKIMVR